MSTQTDALKALRRAIQHLANVVQAICVELRAIMRQMTAVLVVGAVTQGQPPELALMVTRHLRTCSEPLSRVLYLAGERRMGRWPPRGFINVSMKRE